VRVEWDTGATNSYRMGKEGQYDLRLADSVVKALSPDRDNEKDDFLDLQLANDSHPTKLLKQACVKMLQMMATSVGVHGDKMQQSAVLGISSMFRAILSHKSGFMNFGLEQWTTLGFIRATSSSKRLSNYLTSPIWLQLHIDIMEAPIMSKKDVYKKLHCIRLLQATLTTWRKEDGGRINFIVEKIFTILGRICLYCPNDFSLMPADIKSRVLFSASYSGTIAEEIISLIRKLHTLPLWNGVINSFLSQKLCIAAELFSQDYDVAAVAAGGQQTTITVNDADKVAIMGALNAVGGCDSRPR
jgi:E3 ubiquitin-protein ligase HERC2